MSRLGYNPNKTVNVREDLLFKYSKLWNLTSITGEEDDTSLLEAIMMENVGVEIPERTHPDQFEELRQNLKIILTNKRCAKKTFADNVKHYGRVEETGKVFRIIMKRSLEKLIPLQLIGGKKNKSRYISTILKTFTFGYKDALPIKMFTSGIKFKRILWLKKLNKSSFSVKTNYTAKLLLWLWRISKKLIASQYYVSEKQGCYNKLVFIHKSEWQRKTDKTFNGLVNSGCLHRLEPEEAKKAVSCRAQAKLRWLPKEEGLRPIISVRNDKQQEDIILTKSFLNSLLKLTGKDLTLRTLQEKWKEVVELRSAPSVTQLYFVAVDVKDAYGSIIQEKLVDVVKQAVLKQLGDTSVVQFDTGLCGRKRIFVCRELYQGPYYRVLKSKHVAVLHLLKTVENAVRSQTVKWDNKTFLLSKGISQAVSLSAALCKMYLSHLDEVHLSHLVSQHGDIVLRAVDDYLYVTPDKSRAINFLDKMSLGFSDYGMFINPIKTQSNIYAHTEIVYYGFYLNTDNLEVYVKYAQGDSVSFKNLMMFTKWEEKKGERYSILKNKLKRITSFKLNKLTTDESYMTPTGLARNIFETACIMACCYKAIVRTIYQHIDPGQLIDVINYCAASVVCRVIKLTVHASLWKSEMFWIVIRGFRMCLEISSLPDGKGFPESILPHLEHREEEAKLKTKLRFRKLIYDIVDEIPLQYRNGH